ncbi:MAG: 6-phosphogluconolactonase, partial [Bdellovibrionales bacterium]|nr:6-phosphogluconolactonase [Bdellovibrionales bacterium]
MSYVSESAWKIEVVPDKSFASSVCDEIVFSLNEFLEDGESCSMGLAGGSTPGVVYRSLSRPPYTEQVPWDRMRLFLGDERFVPEENDQSNYRMIRETMLNSLAHTGVEVHSLDTSLTTPEESAAKYDSLLRSFGFSLQRGLQLVLLGLGEDGHTASLFPGGTLQTDQTRLVGASRNPSDHTERISLSGPFLQAS